MKGNKAREFGLDVLVDILGGILMALGVYNFAVAADFPLTGFSGLALIIYRLFGLPIGLTTMVLNIPVAIICFRLLGRKFFLRSLKSILITSIIIDVIAPMFPIYEGDRMLAAICAGVLPGLGLALIYMRNSSTGGTDFIIMSIKALNPHLTIGKISFILEIGIIALGAATVFRDVDGIIFAMISNYLMAAIIDRTMYGTDSGKVALVVTAHGQAVADRIDEEIDRGSTILKGTGSFSKEDKEVVMCACNNKQMYGLKKLIKEVDKKAFLVIMESNEVVGEGFKSH
ncbi:YitT family protein [Lachnospiraceae bacterium OttesenSCG-928-E19]|nr:YitT family protein [Lachnospiraceae bacterium OttesenSCG-928-E19]